MEDGLAKIDTDDVHESLLSGFHPRIVSHCGRCGGPSHYGRQNPNRKGHCKASLKTCLAMQPAFRLFRCRTKAVARCRRLSPPTPASPKNTKRKERVRRLERDYFGRYVLSRQITHSALPKAASPSGSTRRQRTIPVDVYDVKRLCQPWRFGTHARSRAAVLTLSLPDTGGQLVDLFDLAFREGEPLDGTNAVGLPG